MSEKNDTGRAGEVRVLRVTKSGNYRIFSDNTCWPTSKACELGHELRYRRGPLTREDRMVISSIVSAYHHLIAHPAGTESAIRSLRKVRKGERLAEVPHE